MTKPKLKAHPNAKQHLQDALKKMPVEVAKVVKDGVKKHAPELLRGHG